MSSLEIEQFFERFLGNLSSSPRDDIHIDRLDDSYRSAENWIRGATSALNEAVALRDRGDWPITVAMEFFLRPGKKPQALQAKRIGDLADQLSYVPPALTAYRSGEEPWTHSPGFLSVNKRFEIQGASCDAVLFQQWFDKEDKLYDRRLWLVSHYLHSGKKRRPKT